MPITWITAIDYDDVRQVLRCRGVMTSQLQDELLKHSSRQGYRNAIYRLAALSHLAPVTDMYGYNAMVDNPEFVVSDLMLKATVDWQNAPAAIYVNLPIGAESYRVAFQARGRIEFSYSPWMNRRCWLKRSIRSLPLRRH